MVRASREPFWISAASGLVWAVIGASVASIGFLTHPLSRQAVLSVAGGVLVSPLIGLAMGAVSKVFGSKPIALRVVIAGLSLYVATFLFVIANNLFMAIVMGRTIPGLWFNSVMVAFAALVWTWFFVVLWPLAYANHVVVSRAWSRVRASNA
jgi:hypothetical protein